MACTIRIFFTAIAALASAISASPCLEESDDLLRYPLELSLDRDTHRADYSKLLLDIIFLEADWDTPGTPEGRGDLESFAARLRELLHARGVSTALEKPREERYTLVFEDVAPEGSPTAQCYLDMARATETDRVVVHVMGTELRNNPDDLADTGLPYFSFGDSELTLSMEVIISMLREIVHPSALHEFQHASFASSRTETEEPSPFDHRFFAGTDAFAEPMDVPYVYRASFSMEELYAHSFDALRHLDRPWVDTSHIMRTEVVAHLQTLISLAQVAEDIAADALERFLGYQDSFFWYPLDAVGTQRYGNGTYGIFPDPRGRYLRLRLPPEAERLISSYDRFRTTYRSLLSMAIDYIMRNSARMESINAALIREVEPMLREVAAISSFVGERARRTLASIEARPYDVGTVRGELERLVTFLQARHFNR